MGARQGVSKDRTVRCRYSNGAGRKRYNVEEFCEWPVNAVRMVVVVESEHAVGSTFPFPASR